ncbi:MAG: VWA domain-containing protein, partial [Clostridiales bacterium]|nr:VWA domain-containing protein [Clostridiales bacterium]
MKKRMNKAIALMLALVLVLASAPLSAAAKQEDFDIQSKGIVENVPARLPADLSDGEIFTYSSVTSEPLPSTDFIVNLSALGQQYVTTTTTVQRFNIVMLLDVSNSMEGSRMTNMVNAANGAIDTLYGNGNKISIITFATETQVDRALSEKDLQLKQSGSSNTGGAVDSIRISLRSNSSYGGTNIQAGLIAAYNVLNNANDDEAIPVIILLSDGAPTYYYSDIDGMRTGSTGRSGNGTTSDTNYAACTIAQAAYLKAIMDDLEIYTIPFSLSTSDSMYDEAAATMNPSDANIAKLNGFNQRWNQALGTVSASNAALMQRYYPNGAYSASNSSASLSEALTKIITDMNFNTPIDETKVNNVLDDASFLWMKYQIGTGYYLKNNTLTVTLNGNSYPLEKIGNEFIYNTPVSDPNYNEKLLRLSVTVSDTGLMTWKIPAKVLPCNTPEGESQVLATPIALTFRVSFNMDMEGLSAGNYPTGDSCLIYFTPTDTNPFYYHQAEKTGPDKLAENDTVLENETRVYSAMYPYPGNDNYARYGNPNPELTGFATGSALDSLSYVSGPQSITVTAYSDYSGAYRDAMTVSYQEQEINFSDIGFKTASASFTTTDKTDISKYRLLSFSDGNGWNTTDNTALSIGLP